MCLWMNEAQPFTSTFKESSTRSSSDFFSSFIRHVVFSSSSSCVFSSCVVWWEPFLFTFARFTSRLFTTLVVVVVLFFPSDWRCLPGCRGAWERKPQVCTRSRCDHKITRSPIELTKTPPCKDCLLKDRIACFSVQFVVATWFGWLSSWLVKGH